MANTKQEANLIINPPNIITANFRIQGDAPYVQNAFSAGGKEQIRLAQEAGHVGKKGKAKQAKDFQALYEGAMHISKEGWHGIPVTSFRAALVSACRLVGFQMTRAKLAVFIVSDGIDKNDGTPLVKITKGKPYYVEHIVRNETGVIDLRPRPMWDPGWQAIVKIRFDADQFALADVANLLVRVGMQVGIGEGRPDSKKSCGMGWGTFTILEG